MSVGNIDSKIRNRPSFNAWIPLALLPITPKRLEKLADYPAEEQELDALQIIHDIISHVLSPLGDAVSTKGIDMLCCDEKIRKCVPKLVAWLADHMENCSLHGIVHNQCPICIASVNELGELTNEPYAPRPHREYAIAYQKSDLASLRLSGVKNINNALWHFTNYQPQDLVKPDTLHTLLLGLLVHLMKWIMDFLNFVGRTTTFDYLWSRLPPYPGFTAPNKAYRSVSQWQGKEMRNLLRVVLGVFAASLSRTTDLQSLSPHHKQLAHKAILCVRYLTDFVRIAQYKVHTPGSIQSMNDYLADFHKYKEVFLRFRAPKAVKRAVRVATRDLRSTQKVEASEASTSKRRKLTEEFRIEQEEMANDLLTEGAHYNFPKMHLISHFADQIFRYGSLPQYSTDICEALHKPLKDGYRRSNHINVLPQIVNAYTRAHTFAMREKNIAQWKTELDHIPEDVTKVLRPTSTSIHIPLGSPPCKIVTKLQGRVNPKNIYNLDTLADQYNLPDLQTLTKRYLIHIYHTSAQPTSDATRFKDAPIEAFHTLQIPVPTFDNDGHILHNVRCTGPELFRKHEKRNDWIFVRHRPASLTAKPGSLDGRVPARLNALFKLRDPHTCAETNISYRLAHISLLKIVGSTTPDGPEGMARVGLPLKNQVIGISNIEGMAHLIPVEPERVYLVNNRIDLHAWNDIHDGN